jgi:hypothetical protein
VIVAIYTRKRADREEAFDAATNQLSFAKADDRPPVEATNLPPRRPQRALLRTPPDGRYLLRYSPSSGVPRGAFPGRGAGGVVMVTLAGFAGVSTVELRGRPYWGCQRIGGLQVEASTPGGRASSRGG